MNRTAPPIEPAVKNVLSGQFALSGGTSVIAKTLPNNEAVVGSQVEKDREHLGTERKRALITRTTKCEGY